MGLRRLLAAAGVAVLALSGCAPTHAPSGPSGPSAPSAPDAPGASDAPGAPGASDAASTAAGAPPRLPAGARFDYQIGGAYPPASDVRIVERDRSQRPVPGRFNVCYVNAYQAQSEQTGWWRRQHHDLLLRDRGGREVVDREWDEVLLDIRTAAKRAALLRIVGAWIDDCARRGFQAVEPDNLDSYTRSAGLLTSSHAIAYAALLSARAHRDHLAVAQKNAAELAGKRTSAGFDFAIAEECEVYRECGAYTERYGRAVLEIEYTDNGRAAFTRACRVRGADISVILRDRDVVPRGAPGYVNRYCDG